MWLVSLLCQQNLVQRQQQPRTSRCSCSTSDAASRRRERRRKDRGPPASGPAQALSSAGDDSREFHLWAWLDKTAGSIEDPAAIQHSIKHTATLYCHRLSLPQSLQAGLVWIPQKINLARTGKDSTSLSLHQQHQRNERKIKHTCRPGKKPPVEHYPFLIHQWTPGERHTAVFTSVVQYQLSGGNNLFTASASKPYTCRLHYSWQ